jgi:HrpA-like RNA helicase/predicted RNA-binding protein YlqC (UPF0109 family)
VSGEVTTTSWSGECKDCGRHGDDPAFVYPDSWIRSMTERGGSKSDRCPACRKLHSRAVGAMAVPYFDIDVIGEVADRNEPHGPLGGLGPLPPPHERVEVDNDYSRFDFGLADADIQRLLEGLRERQVAVVTAGTGSGKSTFLPYRLLIPPSEDDLHLADIGPIVVTEPRKLAAIGCAAFVAKELLGSPHVGAGCDVGYRVKGGEAFDAASRLLYVTDGSLINWLRDGSYERFSTIVVDEAHERSGNIDVILGALRAALPKHPRLRVIIASATIDAETFASFFGGEEHVVRLDVESKKEWGYGRPLWPGEAIDERHPDWMHEDGTARRYNGFSLPAIARAAAQTRIRDDALPTEKWRQQMPSEVAKQVVALIRGTDWGDVLAFLPTGELIKQCAAAIRKAMPEEEAVVYELLASTPADLQEQALAIPAEGQPRRVIVSTNVAETSMTIDGVTFVVDSGLICQKRWSVETASASYPTLPHSQDGVRQRWGRVGRKAPGWVLPLYTREQYESFLEHTPPQVVGDNLEPYVLTTKAVGVDDPEELPSVTLHGSLESVDAADAAQRVQYRSELARAKHALELRGHIDEDGDVTPAGAELLAYSGGVGEAGAMVLADELACPIETATALVLLGAGRPLIGGLLSFNRKWSAPARDSARRSHEYWLDGCQDELDVVLRIWSGWERSQDRRAFCERNLLAGATLRAAEKYRREKLEFLAPGRRSPVKQGVRTELAERVRVVLASAFRDATFVKGEAGWQPAFGEARPAGYELTRGARGGDRGRVVALGRALTMAGADGPAYLSGIIDVEEWPMLLPDVDTLVRGCAARLRAPDGSLRQPADAVGAHDEPAPIGSRWRVALAGDDPDQPEVTLQARLQDAPILAGREDDPELDAADDDDLNDDETGGELISITAREVQTVFAEEDQHRDLEELELAAESDEDLERPKAPPPDECIESELVGSVVRACWAGKRPEGPNAVAQVVGRGGGRIVLRTDAEHGLLAAACSAGAAAGESIEVEVEELVIGWGSSYLVAVEVNSGCPVFLGSADLTFSKYDRTLAELIPVGSRLHVVVESIDVADGVLTVSRLPAVARDLRRLRVGAGGEEWHDAVVSDEKWHADYLVVSLTGGDPATGLLHRFSLPRWKLERRGISLDAGTAVRVKLGVAGLARGAEHLSKTCAFVPEGLAELVAGERDISWDQSSKRLAALKPLTTGARDRLAALSDRSEWKSSMRRLWQDSNLLVALAAEPEVTEDQATGEARQSRQSSGAESAASPGPDLAGLPAATITLSDGKMGLVIGRQGSTIKDLSAMPGIRRIAKKDDQTLSVIAEDDDALVSVVERIRGLVTEAEGTLVLPPGKNGLLIGRGGATINAMRESAGISQARAIDGSSTWRITAPTVEAIRVFAGSAAERVPGSTLTAIRVTGVERVETVGVGVREG